MFIVTINPTQQHNAPQLNLTAIAKSTNSDHNLNSTLEWLREQENKNNFANITAYIDKFSNVFVKDFTLLLKFTEHCINGCGLNLAVGA